MLKGDDSEQGADEGGYGGMSDSFSDKAVRLGFIRKVRSWSWSWSWNEGGWSCGEGGWRWREGDWSRGVRCPQIVQIVRMTGIGVQEWCRGANSANCA